MGNFGSTILDAYLSGQQNKMRRDQLEAQKIQQQEELKLQQEKLKVEQQQFNEKLKQDNEQFKAIQAVRDAGQTLKETVAKQQFSLKSQGLAMQGVAKNIASDVALPSAENNWKVTLATAPQRGTQALQAEQPLITAKSTARMNEQDNAGVNTVIANEAKGAQLKDTALAVEAARKERELAVVEKRGALAKTLASIRSAKDAKSAVDNGDLAQMMELFETGDETYETLRLSGQSQAQKKALADTARKMGITILTPATVKEIPKLKASSSFVRKINEYSDKLEKASLASRVGSTIPFLPTELKKEYDALLTEIGVYARGIGQDTGVISNQDIERFRAIVPRPDLLAGYNRKVTIAALNRAYKDSEEKVLGQIKNPLQRAKIRMRWDLHNPNAGQKDYFQE